MADGARDIHGVEADVHEAAVLAAGYHDFGDEGYREGLGRLLEAIELSDYTAQQRADIRAKLVVHVLRSRLYSERGWHEHPESLGIPLPAPLDVVGMPRTGTTALHKLISRDRRFQGLNGWLAFYPMPRPPRDRWSSILEYRAVARIQEAAMHPANTMKAVHLRTADEVDEALELMSQSFVSNIFPAAFHLPGYDEWFRSQDQRPNYRRLADNLRLIGSTEPEKPWLLKNPDDLLALDDLLDVFPDARIVWIHRNPGEAMASVSSLLAGVRKVMIGPDVKTDDITPREISLWSQGVRRAMCVHDGHPTNFHDVDYREFVAAPMEVARGIYEKFGMTMDPATESAMREWIADNPQGKHGAHSYSRDAFGISDAIIEENFGDYIRRFNLG